MKEKHEAHRLLLEIAEHHFGGTPPAEKRFPENLLSGNNLMRQALVVCQFLDERKNYRHIGLGCRLNLKSGYIGGIFHGLTTVRMVKALADTD